MSDFDFLNEEIKKDTIILTGASINEIEKSGEEKKQRVFRFIESNQNYPFKKLIEKFDLHHEIDKDFGNGVSKVNFYSGSDMRTLVLTMHLPTNEYNYQPY